MKGFAAYTPTRILFGAGSLSQLSGKDIPASKVLLVTGVGGSLRRNGTLAKVEAMLARSCDGTALCKTVCSITLRAAMHT